jgi:hypothetical protein
MYPAWKTYSALPIMRGYIIHPNILKKPKTKGWFFLIQTKLFFYWAVTNSFLVATLAVSNNYNPWWQQTKTSRR